MELKTIALNPSIYTPRDINIAYITIPVQHSNECALSLCVLFDPLSKGSATSTINNFVRGENGYKKKRAMKTREIKQGRRVAFLPFFC